MHVLAIKGPQSRESNDDSALLVCDHRICNMKTSRSNCNELTSYGNGKFLMSWRRRRRRNNNATAAARRNNDNCNYTTTNDFNKVNKLLLITYMLLITAATICQSAAQSPSSSSTSNGGGGGAGGSNGGSPLSAFLKSGGASYNQQLPQQQLFAMLTRNGGSSGSGSGSNGNSRGGYTNARQHFMALSEDDSDAEVDEEDMAALHYPLAASHPPVQASSISIQSGSLETNGFVSDDGGQYEQAQKALEAAAAAAKANNKYNIDCPKDCKCLNVIFDCDKLHLERVPVLPSYVQTLHLANNKLNDTTVLEIRNLFNLTKVSLKRNLLEVIPKFTGLSGLKHLVLANNHITSISSEALAALPLLRTLDLSRNQLHTIEANSFPKPNSLVHLILSFNDIENVNEHAFATLNNLTDLELNNNRLSTLPIWVFKNLSRLKKLALNFNQLEINWSTFRGLISMKNLQLKSNKIKALQDGVFHVMHNIETIDLAMNQISSLSRQGLFNLTKLRHLNLSFNAISRIEVDTWEFTQSLELLDLSNNAISEFKPQHLDCLHRLKTLNLAHNKLQYLQENTFDCVKNLEELNLRRNRLSWIIEDQSAAAPFKSLRKLRRLDLHGNNLKQISSKAITGLNNLEILNLGSNALASIQPYAFDHMLRLNKLVFKSLNFICDCELVWFQKWLKERFPQQAEHAVCGYPEHLLDRHLKSLGASELVCGDSPKPKLEQEPDNMLAVNGANITLECIASSPTAASLAAADELKIKWRHDNQHVQELPGALHDGSSTETQIHHELNTNQTSIYGYLKLTNVTYESAGRYQCVVSNAFGTTYAQKFKISIGIHPTFQQVPSNLTVDAGETARLVCSASGDPTPEIALQKFGGSEFPAATERRLQVIREENAFLITNAKPSDSGIYTCTALSAAGEIKVNATLVVNDKPQPSIPLVHQEVVVGRACVLQCLSETANADFELEHPHREWFKENKPIHISPTAPDGDRYYFSNNKELLVILNAQSNDAGHFRCEITDNSRTFTLQSDLVVVKENLNWDVLLVGIILLTVVCVMVDCCIIWCTLRYQKRKLRMSLAAERLAARTQASLHSTLDKDQTQLTTLNRTQLRPHQSQLVLDGSATQQQQKGQLRPRSLADLGCSNGEATHSRLIVTTTPSYEQRCLEQGLTLSYLQQTDLEAQQDHLSSKDSGTGSDAAVKRSLEDFVVAMPRHKHHTDDEEEDEDNDLQYAPTRALGVSEYDDMELYELNCAAAEQQHFLQNNNHNYDGGGGGGDVGGATGTAPKVMPRKCSAGASGSNYNSIQKCTTVDI
ncbi:leucine-rich repeats and immunoglobulin-like domains protein 3 [Drosophila ficusphila]|uniref:leucine-rich repeats and immunoglobulin-like domains protein 3 n=1 Tax=Drosophila ficusphila TaxID=30025 RepID=UPI0007E6EC36|nr:leucine-rich repeats and immunoglobulin-like domains protein 3 [Drosophila ficusphila]